jgi:hypothetical protein
MGRRTDSIDSEERLLHITYRLIELLNRQELRVTSKNLVRNYVVESLQVHHADKAREAVQRYSSAELPEVEFIRAKFAEGSLASLDELDHLVLRLEFEGHRMDEAAGIDW